MQWVTTTHVRRWREHRANTGEGHLHQGRFKCFMVQHDEHLLTVLRYVEANPLRAGLVKRAKDWPWSSLSERSGSENSEIELSPWPVDRPSNWSQVADQAIEAGTLDQLRTSIARGRPLGSEKWMQRVAKRLGLESTIRDPWRPKKE
jgi:putative transposase